MMRTTSGMKLAATSCSLSLFLAAGVFAQSPQERPRITSISHISVYATDGAKTEHFYAHDLGGFKAEDPQNPAGTRYYFNSVQFVEVLPMPQGSASINRLDHVGYNTVDADGLRKY